MRPEDVTTDVRLRQVDVDDEVPVFFAHHVAVVARHGRDTATDRIADAVDQNIEPAEVADGAICHRPHRRDLRAVRRIAEAFASGSPDLSCDLVGVLLTERCHGDVAAGFCQHQGDAFADATSRAGDQRLSSRESNSASISIRPLSYKTTPRL
jgi:hypothetical protein